MGAIVAAAVSFAKTRDAHRKIEAEGMSEQSPSDSQESTAASREDAFPNISAEIPGDVIHVHPIGENWEIETAAGVVAQAESKEEALEAARETAVEKKATLIIVHTSDGLVEKEIKVAPAAQP